MNNKISNGYEVVSENDLFLYFSKPFIKLLAWNEEFYNDRLRYKVEDG